MALNYNKKGETKKIESNKYSILVVDDDVSILTLIERKLKKAGFETITAQDSKKALELLVQKHVDLIICDIDMPEMDGFEFRQLVLKESSSKGIPFIFLTARSQSIDQARGFKLRADDYITKPFDPLVLVVRVQSVIERHAAYAEKTMTDQLTGLLNREGLEQKIQRELSRIVRYGGIISIVFIDIDDFKQINDRYGHATGDRVLIQLGQLLQQGLRSMDYAGRYGGEEFLLCLISTAKESAGKVGERLLSSFSKTPIGDKKIHCTFSAGVVSAPKDGMDYTSLCKKADEAMYISKKKGKNRITLWGKNI